MNKVSCIICLLFIVGVASLNFTSCEKYILPEMKLSRDTLLLADTLQTVPVGVKCNVAWTISVSDDDTSWVSATPKRKVTGDSTIFITVKANTKVESRETSISVSSETLRKYIFIQQDGVR